MLRYDLVTKPRAITSEDQPRWRLAKKTESEIGRERALLARSVHAKLLRVIPQRRLDDLIGQHASGYRDRVYSPRVTLGLFVEQAISIDQACQDAVGCALSQRTSLGLAPSSLNTGSYCKARQRLPLSLIEAVAQEVAAVAQAGAPAHWDWRGRPIKLMDGTTVSMPDTAANQAVFPQNHQQKPGLGFPLARIVGVIALSSGCVSHWTVSACEGKGTHELLHAWRLLDAFQAGDVAIADRAYGSYFLLAELQQRGVDCVIREHQRRKIELARAAQMGPNDHLLTWDKPQRPSWMDQTTYAAMPDQLIVRQVRDRDWRITTTLTDPVAVSAAEIAWLYRQRWQIELDLRSIKCAMQMDILRCKTPPMVKKEIAAHLLGYNLIRVAMSQAARSRRCMPRQLSFAAARRAVACWQQTLRHDPHTPFANARQSLLKRIAYCRIPYRPNRIEPRAVKRRPKPYPLLTVPRSIARQRLQLQRLAA